MDLKIEVVDKIGLLPFVMGGTTQAAFGFAESEEYDNLNNMALWGMAGSIVGYNAGTPQGDSDSNADEWNAVIWGAGFATMAHLANHSGDTPEAVVHLRIWVQNTATGAVVWTNRAEVKVAPESIYGDKRSKEMFKTAINRATTLLVDDFWNKTKAIM